MKTSSLNQISAELTLLAAKVTYLNGAWFDVKVVSGIVLGGAIVAMLWSGDKIMYS